MKSKSKKAAPTKKVAVKKKAASGASSKKAPNAAAKKTKAGKAAKPKSGSLKQGALAVTREYWVVRATKTPPSLLTNHTSDGKPRKFINDDMIWIENSQGATAPQPLPYELQDGDTICCYNPGDDPAAPGTIPEISSFDVDCYESDGSYYENVIEYDYFADELEVDLSVLNGITEEPAPQGTEPYTCADDGNFSIGIEG